MLRSCYSTKARLVEGSSRQSDLTWYFVPDSYPFLPFASRVNSLNWVDAAERVDQPSHIGEVWQPGVVKRSWSNGVKPTHATASFFCGKPNDFTTNASTLAPPGREQDSQFLPVCCQNASIGGVERQLVSFIGAIDPLTGYTNMLVNFSGFLYG
jgi:hypothetical protein